MGEDKSLRDEPDDEVPRFEGVFVLDEEFFHGIGVGAVVWIAMPSHGYDSIGF